MIKLGINIDHVATLRQARHTRYPNPITAALIAEKAGADVITLHLREDRRHIQDQDVELLRKLLQTRMNFEMAVTDEMVRIAHRIAPHDVCLVPEKRAELTTEGGLDVIGNYNKIKQLCGDFAAAGIQVSLFVDPDFKQVEAAATAGAPVVEIHTGKYADAATDTEQSHELRRVTEAASLGRQLGLKIHAGHGLNYHNVHAIAGISEIEELNIGHAIVAHAIFVGLEQAIREMKSLMLAARGVYGSPP